MEDCIDREDRDNVTNLLSVSDKVRVLSTPFCRFEIQPDLDLKKKSLMLNCHFGDL